MTGRGQALTPHQPFASLHFGLMTASLAREGMNIVNTLFYARIGENSVIWVKIALRVLSIIALYFDIVKRKIEKNHKKFTFSTFFADFCTVCHMFL